MLKNITEGKITSLVGLIVGILSVYGYVTSEQATALTTFGTSFAAALMLFIAKDPK